MPPAVSRGFRAFSVISVALLMAKPFFGYSVLSHEALVDALWDVKLKPVLLARFPNSTREELKKAHGYAYGGAIIQDLGYYPHGSEQFSDLTHYVRTGDFIIALISEAREPERAGFRVGSALALCLGPGWTPVRHKRGRAAAVSETGAQVRKLYHL